MRTFIASVVLLVLVLLAAAKAQTDITGPLMGSEASPGPVAAADEPTEKVYRILVVGDGLAGGLGAGLTRMTDGDPNFEIINRFNESSGLSRPEVYDWPNAISKILLDRPVDAIVVLVGVNDRQDIRSGNFRYPFRSPDWVKGYESNIGRLLAVAKASSAQVFWVSIPPMANPVFDSDMRYLGDIQAKRVTAGGATYVDVRTAFLDAAGQYVDKGLDETGTERKLRSRDGVNFFKQGNNRFGQLVLAEIKKLMASPESSGPQIAAAVTSNAATAKTTIPAGAAPPAVEAPAGVPSFGQDGLDGEQITFQADAVKPVVAAPVSVAQRSVGSATPLTFDIKLAAKPGTAAHRMFTTGEISTPPAGRFDDFAAPTAP
jgi:hypothetical protein